MRVRVGARVGVRVGVRVRTRVRRVGGEGLARGRTEVVALATPRELAGLPSLIDAHLAVNDDVEVRALLALDDDRLLR